MTNCVKKKQCASIAFSLDTILMLTCFTCALNGYHNDYSHMVWCHLLLNLLISISNLEYRIVSSYDSRQCFVQHGHFLSEVRWHTKQTCLLKTDYSNNGALLGVRISDWRTWACKVATGWKVGGNKPGLTMWSSPTRYCSSISLASVEWPTSSKLSVASAPACSSKTSSPPGC